MKVTVAFGDMKIVVPCGSGDFSVKELAAKAVFRMKHSLKFSPDLDRVLVHSLSISRDGGILDWDDLVSDVLDDREQLVAQYSIEASLPEPTFSPPSFKRAPPLAPLVFDVSRLNHPISDHDPGSGGVLLGHTQVGHGNAAGSSSSSLSLSSGSLGGGGVGAGGLHRHRLPHQLHEHHPTSSRHPAPSEFSEHHYHQNQHSLSHQRPLSEIDIPPAGLFEDTNKADSGYKSDHTRLFCDVPPRAAGSGRRTVVTPPLPPPIVCDYDKNSIPTTLSQTAPNTVTASATASLEVPASESCLELPFPTTIKPIAEKLSEVLSKRRAHLRNNWDYEKNDYAEDDEEDEDDVDEDDFMEVSDAISGKRTVFVGVAANVSTASAVDASMTASSSGKRSTTAGTDGEGGDFSDEGLSTVRRVVQQPKEPETKPLPGTQASSPLRAFGGQATKTLDPLISFAENTPLKAPATDWTPLQLRQQLTLIDRQRISSPPAIGVPRTIPEEDENLFNQPSSQQNTFKPKTSPADVHCRPRKIIQEEEEEAETEEDYPMLRLDYRLNEGKESHQSNEPNKAGVHTASPLKPNLPPTEPLQNDRPSHRGLTTPAVLQWLESTQAAAASDGGAMSPFTTPSSIVSGASSAAPTSTGACEEESISASQHDLVSRVIRRNVREASEDLRRGFFLAGYESEPVDIHLTNTMPGENLGIQIKPIFTEPTELIPFVGQVPLHLNSNGKCEAGLEVHAIMPNGRVAREGTLAVGDRILSINGTSLMGIPFDKGREIFQEALKNPELVLHVLPYTGRISSPPRLPTTSTAESNFASPPTVPTREVTSTAAASKDEKPSCGLVLVVDQSEKAKEAETLKPGPPPPPRRSPHTALSQQQQQQADDALGTGKPAPILPPRHKPEIVQPQISPSGLVTKTVRLRKGASGLGFSLTSRDQHQRRPNCPVFIKNILPGGAALLDGNLKPGDRLLKVDDKDVSELGQTASVALLREKPIGSMVTLVVAPGPHHHQHHHRQNQQHHQEQPHHRSSVSFQTTSQAASSHEGQGDGVDQRKHEGDKEDPLKYFAVDPHLVKLHTFEIPISGTSNNETAINVDRKEANRSSSIPPSLLASAFTLGVSVRVRPLTSDDCSPALLEESVRAVAETSAKKGNNAIAQDDCIKNGVFVRTVIPGGAAHKDGRLRVEDRLLAIDNRPLSCLSSPDALHLLKTSISRITADREPFIRLLVSRKSRGLDVSDAPPPLQPPTANAFQRRLGGVNSSPNLKRSEGANSGSLDSLLADAANRMNSFVVLADVHQTAQDATVTSELASRLAASTSGGVVQHPTDFNKHQKNISGAKQLAAQPNAVRKYSSLEVLAGPTSLLLPEASTALNSKEFPEITTNADQKQSASVKAPPATLPSPAFLVASSGVQPGQIYRCDSQGTVHTSTDSDSTTLNNLSGKAGFDVQLSDSSGYDVLAFGPSLTHEADNVGGAASEPEVLPSLWQSGRRRHRRYSRRRARNHRTVVVVKQPKIDLDKMVIVPFEKTEVSAGLQESVAVQTSPPGENEKVAEPGDHRKKHQTGLGSVFWKRTKASGDERGGTSNVKQPSDHRTKRHHPSESALKKLLRFVKPSGRSHSECSAPAARIFSGRTLDRGTVAYTSTHHPSLCLSSRPPLRSSLASPVTIFVAHRSHRPPRPPLQLNTAAADSPQLLVHRAWNASDAILRNASSSPMQAHTTNQTPPSALALDSSTQVTPADEGNYVSLGRRQNYAELSFMQTSVPHQQQPPPPRLVPGSADSTLAHIPPPMAALSLTKLKSVLSSCPPQALEKQEAEGQCTLITSGKSKYTINQLYDMDLSCCSTAYESVVDMRTGKALESNDPATSKTSRKVYEDAEALYRHLSHVKIFDEGQSAPHPAPPEPSDSINSATHPDAI